MRRFFGRDKPKVAKVMPVSREVTTGLASGYSEDGHYAPQVLASLSDAGPRAFDRRPERRRSLSDDHWEDVMSPYDESERFHHHRDSASRTSSFISLPPGASAPTSSPLPRSSSPLSVASHPSTQLGSQRDYDREPATLRSKTPGTSVAALGILKALDPQSDAVTRLRSRSEDHLTVPSEPLYKPRHEKKGFWEKSAPAERDKHHEKERIKDMERKDEDTQAELTRMMGYLTATSSEDWSLVLEVCERASANQSNAREAVRALRREFKYGDPSAQLSAARLWAIMLRNSSETFVSQSTSRKFLDSIEDIIMSTRTSPVVRERLMDVVAAAAYASKARDKDIRGDKEGFRALWKRIKPVDKPDEGVPFDTHDSMFNPPTARVSPFPNEPKFLSGAEVSPSSGITSNLDHGRKHRSSSARDGIISLKEDVRRLFQECKIGQGNASLLSEALAFAQPEDLSKDLIREFYAKCRSSQELIYAQIPWASAGAERSRLLKFRTDMVKMSHNEEVPGKDEPTALTVEENLLAALLGANEALLEALRVHDDLENMALEKAAEEWSRKGESFNYAPLKEHLRGLNDLDGGIQHSTLSPPSGPTPPPQLLLPTTNTVPPEICDPHSSPSSSESGVGLSDLESDDDDSSFDGHGSRAPVAEVPSAKALGKRKVVDDSAAPHGGEGIPPVIHDIHDQRDSHGFDDDRRWSEGVRYVYDAAAERAKQRIRDGHLVDLGVKQ